ncbi:putative methyl-accepting chemotaxis protein [Vibrio phage 424E50-1]|nr:putative methyl-accepting chemotaxis protein [Vibrio phage 424E50-1]
MTINYDNYNNRLEAATSEAEDSSAKFRAVANGDENTEVPLDTGSTPSIRKFLKEQESKINVGAQSVLAQCTEQKDLAEAQATIATEQVELAENQVTAATEQATLAAASAAKAEEVAGLTQVQEAIDLTLSEFAGLMTESEVRAIQATNLNHFDASGMVHMGRSLVALSAGKINEGMMVSSGASLSLTGQIGLGLAANSTQPSLGTSETKHPILHVAGSTPNISTIEENLTGYGARFKLPEAEDGTRIYDSTGDARGSGKASLDLKVDVDPKYGNAPTGTEGQILREGVGRAFEGVLKNGDVRLGDNGDWSASGDSSVSQGYLEAINGGGSVSFTQTFNAELGKTYKLSMSYKDKVGARLRFTLSGIVDFPYIADEGDGTYSIEWVSTVTGNVLLVINRGVGDTSTWKVSDVSIKPVTEEVVTHPVDGVFLEYYEEELTDPREEVMECIQSLSTTFGDTDVPTVLSTRPLSYFQQYDGQFADPTLPNDKYRCVVWGDLTDEQKRKVAAYMGEKLFIGVNGNIVNGRLRARTIRGAGNGDWLSVRPTEGTGLSFGTSVASRVAAQGALDSSEAYSINKPYMSKASNSESFVEPSDFSLWYLRDLSSTQDIAYQGRCFMYVVATVPRANKGAYHPDLNPWGTAFLKRLSAAGGKPWHDSSITYTPTHAECFIEVPYATSGKKGYEQNTGKISNGQSGHPDGIFYDGIEAGGLNGVIDLRLGAVANDSPSEVSKTLSKVENGTYRGLEKLVRTIPVATKVTKVGSYGGYSYVGIGEVISQYTSAAASEGNVFGQVIATDGTMYDIYTAHGTAGTEFRIRNHGTLNPATGHTGKLPVGADITIVLTQPINLSVSGEFNTQMVIGDPANLLLTDALKNGWLGTWCPVIPNGVIGANEFYLTRKCLEPSIGMIYTEDNGGTWANAAQSISNVTNSRTNTSAYPTTRVIIHNYKAFAKQTKPSTNKPVYNGKAGLMGVFVTSDYRESSGVHLAESLISKVLKASTGNRKQTVNLTAHELWELGQLSTGSGEPRHIPFDNVSAPNNNSPAIKILPYQISNNGQGSIGFQANELTWKAPVVTEETATTSTVVDGSLYRPVTGSGATSLMYITVQATYDGGINWANYSLIDGKIYANTDLTKPTPNMVVWNGSGWGDDDTIKITSDGSDTFVDRNGIVNESVVHELAIPCTWISNRARSGEQVEGVDL